MKRKTITILLLTVMSAVAIAQKADAVKPVKTDKANIERGTFNHLGFYVGPGSEGVSLGIATCATPYVELSAGMNIVPGIKFNSEEEIDYYYPDTPLGDSFRYPSSYETDMKFNLARTTLELKASIYPFGGNSTFCLVTGLSFGGKKAVKITAHDGEVARIMQEAPGTTAEMSVEDYVFKFDKQGNLAGDVRLKAVRPYLGIGVGRHVTKRRVGFRFDLGCQFSGNVNFYQDNRKLTKQLYPGEEEDKKIYEKVKLYPVVRFSITGRIL